jgi:hypothetical protein
MGNKKNPDQSMQRATALFEEMSQRNARQKAAIDRLLQMSMAAVEALTLIRDKAAEAPNEPGLQACRKIAAETLQRIESIREASVEESQRQ